MACISYREGAAALYDVAIERPTPQTHAVDWCRKVLPALGLDSEFDFEWLPSKPWVADKLADQGYLPSKRWMAVCPGARWPSKQWPLESFANPMEEIGGDPNVYFIVVGGAEDRAAGKQLSLIDRCLDLTGKTTLPELVEWLRVCDVLVTNDTGPMHIGSALGVPTLGIFSLSLPLHYCPVGNRDRYIRKDSIEDVEIGEVIEVAEQMWATAGPDRRP